MKTVTVGIPAYNEYNTIGELIKSIQEQKQIGYTIEKIIVICDGSSDGTPEEVKKLFGSNSKIKLIDDRKRLGKSARLNQIYRMNTSDILVTFDADILLCSTYSLYKMVSYFDNKNVGLVSGNGIPTKPSNYIHTIINTWYNLWYFIRKDYNRGDNIHNIHGNMSALRKDLAEEVVYPKGITSDQDFLYMTAKKLKMNFRFAKNATFYVNNPNNINDFYMQASRFADEKEKMVTLFGDWIQELYTIPTGYKLRKMLQYSLSKPISTSLATFIYLWFAILPHQHDTLNEYGMWQEAKSTKKIIH